MARNIQKRLFIGIGTELLLKSLFLKNDYCINKIKRRRTPNPNKPTKFSTIVNSHDLNPNDTYGLNKLIENISEVINSTDENRLTKGLKIAKVFRNKEGHVASLWHDFDPENYTDIEKSIMEVYDLGFNEKLTFQVSFEKDEEAKFKKE